jgi:hypothetical protein
MNETELDNIIIIIKKLKDDISQTLSYFKDIKKIDTPEILNVLIFFISDDKVDVLFFMPPSYYNKIGYKLSKNLISQKIDEYLNKYSFFKMLYLSDITPERKPDLIV